MIEDKAGNRDTEYVHWLGWLRQTWQFGDEVHDEMQYRLGAKREWQRRHRKDALAAHLDAAGERRMGTRPYAPAADVADDPVVRHEGSVLEVSEQQRQARLPGAGFTADQNAGAAERTACAVEDQSHAWS